MTNRAQASRIRFGAFEADLSAGELRRGGLKIKLQPQPFEILTTLLERAGEPVTREELHTALWSDDTFVEFDLALNTAIKKLRVALRDDAKHPRYIETLPRKGYRFVFPVEYIPATGPVGAANDEEEQEIAPPAESKPRRKYWRLAAAAAALIVGGATLAGLVRGPMGRALLESGERSQEMLFSERFVYGSAVSPNGLWAAYRDGETAHVWLVDLASKSKRLLVEDWASYPLVWSPDSTSIAYIKLGDPPRGLETVEITTGARRRVPIQGDRLRVVPWDWAADGRLLCTYRLPDAQDLRQIAFIDVQTGVVTPVRQVKAGSNNLRLSPDQRLIAFERRANPVGPGQRDILVVPASEAGEEVVVSDHPENEASPFWSFGGRQLFFVRRTEATGADQSLWAVDLNPQDGSPATSPFQVSELGSWTVMLRPSMSHTGEIFVSRSNNRHFQLYLLPLDPSTGKPTGKPESNFPKNTNGHHWSADGKWIGFISADQNIPKQILGKTFVERNLETGEERLMTAKPHGIEPAPQRYSRSETGGWVAYQPRNENVIYLRDLRSGGTRKLLEPEEPISRIHAFEDGSELLFSTHSAGRNLHSIKVLRLSDGSVRSLGVSRPPPQLSVSPDGREIAIGDYNCLVVLQRDRSAAEELACAPAPNLPGPDEYKGMLLNYTWESDLMPSWSPEGDKIAWTVTVEDKKRVELWIIDRLTGTHEVAWAGEENYYTLPRGPLWSPAGDRLAFCIQQYRDHEIWALRGFTN